MKIGITKLHENEWQIQVGQTRIKLDRFSTELLNITLEHAVALEEGKHHSTLESYVKLGMRLQHLDDINLQNVLRDIKSVDLVNLILCANTPEFNEKILRNVGSIKSKQIAADIDKNPPPLHEAAKDSIRRIVEHMFALEAKGEIDICCNQVQRYI